VRARPGSSKRHVDAACLNTGELTLIVFGTARKTPGRPIAKLYLLMSAGGEAVGSGKPETPWARMHCAMVSHSARCCAAAPPFGGAAASGSSFAQSERAALNDGEAGLIPEPIGIWMPPPLEGSGKFGTPWLRMQSAKAIPETGVEPLRFLLPEAPHEVTTSPQPIRISAIASFALIHDWLYRRAGNSPVTSARGLADVSARGSVGQ